MTLHLFPRSRSAPAREAQARKWVAERLNDDALRRAEERHAEFIRLMAERERRDARFVRWLLVIAALSLLTRACR